MASAYSKAMEAIQNISSLSRLELLYLEEKISQQLNKMPLTECFLLKLPRELRDRIYYFVAMVSIGDPNNKSDMPVSGLSGACKQSRAEFDEIIYSSKFKIIKIEYYQSGSFDWKVIEEPKTIRALLNGKIPSFSCRPVSYDTRAALRQQVERDGKWADTEIQGVLGLATADEGGGLYRFNVSKVDLSKVLTP